MLGAGRGSTHWVSEKHRFIPSITFCTLTFSSIAVSKMFCPLPERVLPMVLISIAFAHYTHVIYRSLTARNDPLHSWFPSTPGPVLVICPQGRAPFPPEPSDAQICLWKGVPTCFQPTHTWPKHSRSHSLWGPSS